MNKSSEEILITNKDIKHENLIPILQDLQLANGYLSEEIIRNLSTRSGIPASKIYSIATFYNQFRFGPIGKFHVQVCKGTACHLAEVNWIIRELEKVLKIKAGYTTKDGLFSLETVPCVGACSLAPVLLINEKYHGKLTPTSIRELIQEYRNKA
ncbi:MAG: NADH-quinone oxidoreductase subunit NuoE [Bacteroidales bacterium]|nr:NADH-quinone oxidoreductase subunit NuoE [Bacteroidales bacterium]